MTASAPSGPAAVLITVGDELLSGRTVDTNAAWLGRALGDRGVGVLRHLTVADEAHEIRRATAEGLEAARLVVVSGGLGPTPDDLTRDAVADLLERPLEVDGQVLEAIRRRFREAGRDHLPDPNLRVAQVPQGARVYPNPVGTAPGLALEQDGRWVLLLPGVPGEMRALAEVALPELVRDAFGDGLTAVRVRHIHTTGIPESELSQALDELLPDGPGDDVQMAFLPDLRGVDLRLTALGMSEEAAEEAFDALEARMAPVLDRWRFEAPERGDLAEAVLHALRRSGATVALAESCTGGLLAKRLTDVPGASDVVVGGVVAYADLVKTGMLDVPATLLAAHGAVSEEVARAMALGVMKRLGASAAVAVTGVAGPGGGSKEKPVGTVCYAAATEEGVAVRRRRFPGDREGVRERSGQAALALLLRLLEGTVAPDGD